MSGLVAFLQCVITVAGNHKRSMECASAGSNLAQSLVIAAEKKKLNEVANLAQQAMLMKVPDMSNPNGTVAFQPSKDTKQIPLDAAFPDRTVTIGSKLDAK